MRFQRVSLGKPFFKGFAVLCKGSVKCSQEPSSFRRALILFLTLFLLGLPRVLWAPKFQIVLQAVSPPQTGTPFIIHHS